MLSDSKISRLKLSIILLAGTILFVPLFILREIGPLDFWWWMSANLLVLICLSLIFDKRYLNLLKEDFSSGTGKKILLGVLSAAILYGIFWIGNLLSRKWFGFAGEGIQGVYDFKGNASYFRILGLMALIIGPGEEIFWRGVIQRWFSDRLGGTKGFILALLIYTGVHVFSFNIMLIVAAFVAGLFWGLMYLKFKSVFANIISHTLWDIMVFLILPFN